MPTLVRRVTRRGIPGWLEESSGRWLPIIAGAEGDGGDGGSGDGGDGDGGGGAAAVIVPARTGDQAGDDAGTDALGEVGQRALEAERKRANEADKARRDAERRLKAIEDANLSETEKLKREAEEGRQLASAASQKLQRANLLTALGEEGFTGAKSKAVARLLDGVEFDDDDEPTNLKQALKAAEGEFGDLVKPGPARAADFDGGARTAAPADSMDEMIRQLHRGRR